MRRQIGLDALSLPIHVLEAEYSGLLRTVQKRMRVQGGVRF